MSLLGGLGEEKHGCGHYPRDPKPGPKMAQNGGEMDTSVAPCPFRVRRGDTDHVCLGKPVGDALRLMAWFGNETTLRRERGSI